MKKPTKAELRDRLRSHCREHRLRVTPQREAIYRELCCDGTHPTAEQLTARLRSRFPNLSLDTVNRTLLTFAEIGLVDIVEGRGSPRRYDPDTESHHHAYCIRCGAILDFQNARYDDLKVPAEVRAQVQDHQQEGCSERHLLEVSAGLRGRPVADSATHEEDSAA